MNSAPLPTRLTPHVNGIIISIKGNNHLTSNNQTMSGLASNVAVQGLAIGGLAYWVLSKQTSSMLYTPDGRLKMKWLTPKVAGALIAGAWVAMQMQRGKMLELPQFGAQAAQFAAQSQVAESLGAEISATARAGASAADTFFE